MTSTVRIPVAAKSALEDMAKQDKMSLQDVLAALVERERRRRILEATDASYAELRNSPEDWAEYQREVALWDTTTADGVEGA